MCQYLREIQTVGTHDKLIRSGNLTRTVNFCGTGVSVGSFQTQEQSEPGLARFDQNVCVCVMCMGVRIMAIRHF